MFAASLLPAAAHAAWVAFFIPESPRWLLGKGRVCDSLSPTHSLCPFPFYISPPPLLFLPAFAAWVAFFWPESPRWLLGKGKVRHIQFPRCHRTLEPLPFPHLRDCAISPFQPVKKIWKAVTFLNCNCISPESRTRLIEEIEFSFRLERAYGWWSEA
jgi:hypothetical protein